MSYPIKLVKLITPIALAVSLAACGGSSSESNFGSNTGGTSGATTETLASSIELSVSSRQLSSDGSAPITITAIAKDQNNNAIDGADIVFSVDKDATIIKDATVTTVVDPNDPTAAPITTVVTAGSIQTAILTPGSNTNQTLIVSVVSGSTSKSITIEVVGTTVSIDGPKAITIGKDNTFLLKLKDSSNNPIAFEQVEVSSANGNSITTDSNYETDANGEISFILNSSVSGTDTINVNVLGVSYEKVVDISSDDFSLSNNSDEININTNSTVSFKWLKGAAPQSGKTIVLSATRGDIVSQSKVTNSAGEASFSLSSKTAGQTIITATSADGLSASLNREFVATTPAYLNTQASPTLIAPNTVSTIIAKIRDLADNPVKNKIIDFRLEDTVDGILSASTAITDSLGRASVSYTAGNSSSATNGVKISTFIQGYPAIPVDDVSLTVGGNALRLVLGDDQLIASNEVFYTKQFGVIVTDSAGNAIADKDVSFTINPTHYYKGFMRTVDTDGDGKADRWSQFNTLNPDLNGDSNRCVSEDFDQDGNLDIADGEDINGNGALEPTQEAVVTGTGKTDADGKIVVQVTYLKSSALWSRQRIMAKTQIEGTEFVESADFDLPILAADLEAVDVGVPNAISPYGFSDRCDTDNNNFNLAINPRIVDVLTGGTVTALSNDVLYQINFIDALGNNITRQNFTINSTVVNISDEPNNSFRLTDRNTATDNSGFFIELTVDGTTTPLLYQDDVIVPPLIDTDGPIITLNGAASITLILGDVYDEQGANAVDLKDAGVVAVSRIGNVPVGGGNVTTTAGTYTLIYTATDSDGNVSTMIRTVIVNNP
jgi:hypothetical protein